MSGLQVLIKAQSSELWSHGFGILVRSLCLKQPQTPALQHDALDAANQGCEVSGLGSIWKV